MVADDSTANCNDAKPYLWKRELQSWGEFCRFFNEEFDLCTDTTPKPLLRHYVWRGHRRDDWRLLSSFDRVFSRSERFKELHVEDRAKQREIILTAHLNSFAYACRGKLSQLGISVMELKAYIRRHVLHRNHIWALGQHYGLVTPLLDWCYSPFAAAFFAFEEERENTGETNDYRVVFGLKVGEVCDVLNLPLDGCQLAYFDPMSSEHPRLVNQRGLFTVAEKGIDIETLLKKYEDPGFRERNRSGRNHPWLIRIRVPDTLSNRQCFLRALNAMNINHISLFPEIGGAAEFCNLGIELDGYAKFHGQSPSE
ncbi:FRG domain-containing protein [Anaerobaca lacustris]|uniref:FRG domain-containing protein n=1 Tax=Anaerobaca lacustris TaxID=3044600 RepID=A0AAW6U2H9_9BACT|nr:FRG domain-containing protein [Sedimentisphaerales bacterium M17dextr]